jgi:hypothetical protein
MRVKIIIALVLLLIISGLVTAIVSQQIIIQKQKWQLIVLKDKNNETTQNYRKIKNEEITKNEIIQKQKQLLQEAEKITNSPNTEKLFRRIELWKKLNNW